MEINVRDERKIVEVWLTNAEKQDASVREMLGPLYRACTQKGYLAAVYQSGTQDLAEVTSELLCYSRKRSAQWEAERESRTAVIPEG